MPKYQSFRRPGALPGRDNRNATDFDRSLAARWGSQLLFRDGFVAVPAALLKCYTRLGLSNSELVFVLQLMSFKWDENAPFPSYKTLAQRMGITTEMARRHAKGLESKELLRRVKRTGQSNAFDLRSFTAALESFLAGQLQGGKEAA